MAWLLGTLGVALAGLALYDLLQRHHAVLRNFPVVGHLRYLLETFGPELRQYIVTDNDEERPFSRDQRRWIYASAKRANNYFGFGTDNELEAAPHYLIIKHAAFPLPHPAPGAPGHDPEHRIPCAKILGGARGRRHAFRPASVINVSAMSFGSLSGPAVEALNRGARRAGCLHNTGEGGVSRYHLHGGELIWQIGTAYFGCRDAHSRFSLARLQEVIAGAPVRALEIKLSQGAKPGLGGILPAAKVTPEIAQSRGISVGRDCHSPARHSEFSDVDGLLDFVERLAEATGLPVGIKSAVGELAFWRVLAAAMEKGDRGVDFITIDGGEGGTGAGPLAFTDSVAYPFKIAMSRAYREFAARGLNERIVFIGSGKLGFPEAALFGFALGCDMINVAREALLATGCIQAQRCHTGHCPTGITTQNRWLVRGLDPTLKAARAANYIIALRHEVLALCHAAGVPHPALISAEHLELVDDRFGGRTIDDVFAYEEGWSLPAASDRAEIERRMELPEGPAPGGV